jgi:hypothetical protein
MSSTQPKKARVSTHTDPQKKAELRAAGRRGVRGRWTVDEAAAWGERTPWLVGCNYAPRTAINQLEMWQADSWDPKTIKQELGWAASLGFNSVRVFLHDLVWAEEGNAYLDRIDQFLSIADKHGIGVMPVFFDSVWHPFPQLGVQRAPEPGVHNSGWVQSPGVAVLRDEKRFAKLKGYVTAVIKRFADDPRVQVWDVWNEPDNNNAMSYGPRDIKDKGPLVTPLIAQVFEWARSAKPSQPLTSAVWWGGHWDDDAKLQPWEKVQLEESDVVSFHWYGTPETTEEAVKKLQRVGRPLLCTEYMARANGSTFEGVMPVLQRHKVGAYNWGFVAGKSQTNYAWDSWQKPYGAEPPVWFHDIFRGDGTAYKPAEVKAIRRITGASPRG